ncbi:5-deoxy-D-glucuronate isomerase [Paraburkholderia sp. UCT70]
MRFQLDGTERAFIFQCEGVSRKPIASRHQVSSPTSPGWKYVGFDVFDLKVGATVTQETGDREVVVVLVRGHATVGCEGLASRAIGARMSPFDGAPWSMYVPPHTRYTIVAADDVELGVCSAPAKGGLPPRFIAPDEVRQETRGAGANLRHVRHILPETEQGELAGGGIGDARR